MIEMYNEQRQSRNYLHKPPDYRYTQNILRLVMAISAPNLTVFPFAVLGKPRPNIVHCI